MAEVRKKKKVAKYNIDEMLEKKNDKDKNEKSTKKSSVKSVKSKDKKIENKSLWVRFRIFCHGVKSEFDKVHWPDREKMVKYSIATIIFVIFCSLFFYLIEIIFARLIIFLR